MRTSRCNQVCQHNQPISPSHPLNWLEFEQLKAALNSVFCSSRVAVRPVPCSRKSAGKVARIPYWKSLSFVSTRCVSRVYLSLPLTQVLDFPLGQCFQNIFRVREIGREGPHSSFPSPKGIPSSVWKVRCLNRSNRDFTPRSSGN